MRQLDKTFWIGFLLLMCAGVTSSQTKHAPAKESSQKNGSVLYTIAVHGDHGCNYSFYWDEATKSCTIKVTFTKLGKISCSPVATNSDGDQFVVCSYKPDNPAVNKEPQ